MAKATKTVAAPKKAGKPNAEAKAKPAPAAKAAKPAKAAAAVKAVPARPAAAKPAAKPAQAKPTAVKPAVKSAPAAKAVKPAKAAAPAAVAAIPAKAAPVAETRGTPLIEMRDISIAFGGIKAVDHASVDLYPGEVVGLLGHNGAGKSTLIKILSGAYKRDHGQIFIEGSEVDISNPRDAKAQGIETIYQTLALADNVDAAANLYLGRELKTPFGTLDDVAMEDQCRKVMHRLNPNFRRFKEPVSKLSGGQRQSVAIARAIHFNARILIMDEPTAALGPQETAQVGELIKQLKAEGIGIFLISHDLHDVFDLADRLCVMKNGKVVGTAHVKDVDHDEVLGMIIAGKCPKGAIPGPGALAS